MQQNPEQPPVHANACFSGGHVLQSDGQQTAGGSGPAADARGVRTPRPTSASAPAYLKKPRLVDCVLSPLNRHLVAG
jgi:hypothetical protein